MLRKFIDPLPIPSMAVPKGTRQGVPFYEVNMLQVKQKLHTDLPSTTVWGYDGLYPGPSFDVQSGHPIKVKWINCLPKKHLLAVDKTVHGAQSPNPEVRTVVHLHGGNTPAGSDGDPDAWFTRRFKTTGTSFKRKIYTYPNPQPAANLWYHDHALGITRLNVYAGLAGIYLIRDKLERNLRLPRGKYEIPLLIQDRSFKPNGALFYPRQTDPPTPGVDPSIVPEFFGNTILVNGKVWPFLSVEPRKYRFRIYNGANSRFYRLRLSNGQPFFQIGTDSGLMERTVKTEEIILAPAERVDVILDFASRKGQRITLTNDAPSPFPNGDPVDSNTGQVMQFQVSKPLKGTDTSKIPSNLVNIKWLRESEAVRTRNQTLTEMTDSYGRLMMLLQGLEWSDPITDKPRLGDVEIWNLINPTEDTHPIHLHLVRFQILDRQPFDVNRFEQEGKLVFTGLRVPPAPNEQGWKDTVRVNPGEVTRIITEFRDFTGIYPWHCHILEHEDYDMMRPFEVVPRKYPRQ